MTEKSPSYWRRARPRPGDRAWLARGRSRCRGRRLDGPALEETGHRRGSRRRRRLNGSSPTSPGTTATENPARHRRTLRPRRYTAQQCRHQYRSAAARRRPRGKLWETTPEEFRRIIEVNVVAPFLMTRAVLPTLLAQRWADHQCDDESRHHVARHDAALWRLQSGQRSDACGLGAGLDGTGVTANVLVPGGAADTRMVSRTRCRIARRDRARGDGRAAGLAVLERFRWRQWQRFIATKWNTKVPSEQAVKTPRRPRPGNSSAVSRSIPRVAVRITGLPERGPSRHWRKLRM